MIPVKAAFDEDVPVDGHLHKTLFCKALFRKEIGKRVFVDGHSVNTKSIEIISGEHPVADSRSAEFVFDEFRTAEGSIRPHWQRVDQAFLRETPADLTRRWRHAERIIHENGTTYNVFGTPQDRNRPWEVDLLPLILPQAEWQSLSAGIAQRARLLALVLDDIYGPQDLLKEGWLPPEIVFAHPDYWRPFHDLPVETEQRIVLSGTELTRTAARYRDR